jgi:hypothetical protein
LDAFSNAFVPWETMVTSQLPLNPDVAQQIPFDTLHSLGSLYFCVPGNEKLDDLWDTVADRLFKIRHCMNLDGVERSLPLFEPPIDPALLVKAAAAGLDIAAVLSDIEAPLPLYRFNVMLPKALELCAEVRALGSALLSGCCQVKRCESRLVR